MITATSILYIYTETPLHVGSGSGLSNVDLPIQRERTTQYPMIQGSGIKGKLRASAEDEPLKDMDVIFGSSREIKDSTKNGTRTGNSAVPQEYAGAFIIGDARILLFPVRSLNGIFAYVTSYDVLHRFARDLERSHVQYGWSIPEPITEQDSELPIALVTSPSDLTIKESESQQQNNASEKPEIPQKTIVLEEFSFEAREDPDQNGPVSQIAKWLAEKALPSYGIDAESTYWQEKLKKSLVILPDEDFRDFVLYATEVITRIRIERETKIVKDGALWTEEHLPADTLLYVPTYATNSRRNGHTLQGKDILQSVSTLNSKPGSYLQLGGDETVGRGMVRTRWSDIKVLRAEKAANNSHSNTVE